MTKNMKMIKALEKDGLVFKDGDLYYKVNHTEKRIQRIRVRYAGPHKILDTRDVIDAIPVKVTVHESPLEGDARTFDITFESQNMALKPRVTDHTLEEVFNFLRNQALILNSYRARDVLSHVLNGYCRKGLCEVDVKGPKPETKTQKEEETMTKNMKIEKIEMTWTKKGEEPRTKTIEIMNWDEFQVFIERNAKKIIRVEDNADLIRLRTRNPNTYIDILIDLDYLLYPFQLNIKAKPKGLKWVALNNSPLNMLHETLEDRDKEGWKKTEEKIALSKPLREGRNILREYIEQLDGEVKEKLAEDVRRKLEELLLITLDSYFEML